MVAMKGNAKNPSKLAKVSTVLMHEGRSKNQHMTPMIINPATDLKHHQDH
jgi:hypothetical protein